MTPVKPRDLNNIRKIPAADQQPRRPGYQVSIIVAHAMQSGERADTAESCGQWFSKPYYVNGKRVLRSTHYGVDNDSTIEYVPLSNRCYGAGGANDIGIHIEQAGMSEQSPHEWGDAYSLSMIDTQTVPLVAALCMKFRIPPIFLDAAALRRGERGITTHHHCSQAFGGDHWDPGPAYPMQRLITGTIACIAGMTHNPPPYTPPGVDVTEDDHRRIEAMVEKKLKDRLDPNGNNPTIRGVTEQTLNAANAAVDKADEILRHLNAE